MIIKMRAWHCYYHLILGFFILHSLLYIGAMLIFKDLNLALLGLLLVEAFLVVGLYGFVKKRPIYKPWLWQGASVIGVVAMSYQAYEMRIGYWFGDSVSNYAPVALMIVLLAPWLYGLIRYGFLSREIWNTRSV